MSSWTALPEQPSHIVDGSNVDILNDILGVAIFDMNGLPQEYYTTPDNRSTSWVQTVFQALGLKSLLIASLKLEGFQHIIIHTNEHDAVVVRYKNAYTAFLLKNVQRFIADIPGHDLGEWLRDFDSNTLRQHDRFQAS